MSWFNFFTQEIAIDLGTANTLIIHNDKVVVDESTIEENKPPLLVYREAAKKA